MSTSPRLARANGLVVALTVLLVGCVADVPPPSAGPDGGSPGDGASDATPPGDGGTADTVSDGTVAASSIAFVQAIGNSVAQGSTTTLAFPSDLTAHDAIIVCVAYTPSGSNETLTGITDTLRHTYKTIATFDGNGARHYISFAPDTTSGADTLTVTMNGSVSSIVIQIHEYAGLARSSAAFDKASNGGATATAPAAMSSGTATTTAANELIFGYADANTVEPGSDFTLRNGLTGNITEDKVVTVAGSYEATARMTAGNSWTMMMATFRGQ